MSVTYAKLTDMSQKPEGVWIERFEGCDPPPAGATFQVVDDHWDVDTEPLVRVIRRYRIVAGPVSMRRLRVTPEVLRVVASLAELAKGRGASPVRAVQEGLNVGERAAQLWLKRAKDGTDPDTGQAYLTG